MANDHNIRALPAEIVRPEDPLLISERVAVAAFLAGYSGGTRVSYTTDLRIFAEWCHDRELNLLNVKRAHLELFAGWMEQHWRMPSTIGRRLSTLSSFYKYCQIEDIVIDVAQVHVQNQRVHRAGPDRSQRFATAVGGSDLIATKPQSASRPWRPTIPRHQRPARALRTARPRCHCRSPGESQLLPPPDRKSRT